MICKCGHTDLSPTITGIYTLKVGVPHGAGYTCKGCGTDGMILWADMNQSQRHAAMLAEQSRDAASEMMMAPTR
jgi:hypothetical protein